MFSRVSADRLHLAAIFGRDRRRGHRIDPAFQSRFRSMMLAFSILILLMVTVLARAVLYVVVNPDVPVSLWVPASLFALAAGIALVVFYLSDRFSHRYCGPVYKLSITLDAIQRGEHPAPIRLRKHDEFQELAAKLNETLQQLGAMDRPSDQATGGSDESSIG